MKLFVLLAVAITLVAALWGLQTQNRAIGQPAKPLGLERESSPSLNAPVTTQAQQAPVPVDETQNHPVYESRDFLAQLNQPYAFGIVAPSGTSLIWTSAGDQTFQVANRDGSSIRDIQSNFEDPYDLRIDTSFGHTLYLISDGQLQRRTLDFESETHTDMSLLTLPSEAIHGLGYDDQSNTLYLGDSLGRPRFAISLSDEPKITIKTITLLTHSTQEEP